MKKIIFSINGFTVIEMMIAIIIAGLITAAISSFLLVHIKSYKTSENMISLQYDGQVGLNEISNIAMESQGVYKICLTNDLGILVDIDLNSAINKISIDNENEFIVFAINSKELIEYHIITLKENTLVYNVSKNPDLSNSVEYSVIGKNIKSFNLTPFDDKSFIDSKGIEIEFELEKDDTKLTVSTQAKYRNKR